jgi:plastocyanin
VSGRRWLLILAVMLGVVGIGLVVAGVLRDDSADSSDDATNTSQPAGPSIELAPGTLGALDREFFPNPFLARAGATMTFLNTDSTTHTFTADDASFDSGDVAPGESYQTVVPATGPVAIHCNIHGTMRGTINVVPEDG